MKVLAYLSSKFHTAELEGAWSGSCSSIIELSVHDTVLESEDRILWQATAHSKAAKEDYNFLSCHTWL